MGKQLKCIMDLWVPKFEANLIISCNDHRGCFINVTDSPSHYLNLQDILNTCWVDIEDPLVHKAKRDLRA